jgi:DNA-binding GntR family transcriptional regulator
MAKTAGTGRTRADVIFEQLRYDILNGYYAPGSKLPFAELGSRYEASTGVLREVLPRLVEQGLATNEAQLGFRVVTVSVDDLERLTDARCAIETMVARLSVESGDVAWEARLVAAHHALTRTTWLDDPHGLAAWVSLAPAERAHLVPVRDEWATLHEAFHHTLLEGCDNPYLIATATKLRRIADVYRYWSADESERVHRDVDGEHKAILDAALARDAQGCADLLADHIRLTTELLVAVQRARAETVDA